MDRRRLAAAPSPPHVAAPESPVKVIWDLDSCPIPPSTAPPTVVRALRRFAGERLGHLQNITCFSSKITVPLQKDLEASSVRVSISPSLISDLALATELFKIVADHRPPYKVVLLMDDRVNLIPTIEAAVVRGYEILLMHPPGVSSALLLSATNSIEWNVFLGVARPSTLNLLSRPAPTNCKALSVPRLSPGHLDLHRRAPQQLEASNSKLPGPHSAPVSPASLPPDLPNLAPAAPAAPAASAAPASSEAMSTTPTTPSAPCTMYPGQLSFSPSLVYEGAAMFFGMLPAALAQLKRQYFTPTETAIKGALKSLQRNRAHKVTLTPAIWEEVVALAHHANYVIVGKPPKRVLYQASDCFEGVDPDHPATEFPEEVWASLRTFLREASPGKKNGRFGFAECLSCKGPPAVRELPLGKICELVQQGIMRKMLEFHRGYVSVSEAVEFAPGPSPARELLPVAESPHLRASVGGAQVSVELDLTDENSQTILALLPAALDTLQEDMLKPYEQVVQARVRQLAEDTKLSFKKKHWGSVLSSAIRQGFTVCDTPLGKLIYSPRGSFHGVDPRHPQSRFEGYVWDALQAFLVSIHPLRYPLRYQFATFLKKEGPPQLQVLPLGIISELIEAAISRGYLCRLDPKTIATTDFIPSYSNEGDLQLSLGAQLLRVRDDAVAGLQLVCHRFFPTWPLPIFIVVDCAGPPHSPTYMVIAVLLNVIVGEGTGSSKMEGHAAAALNALTDANSLLLQLFRLFLAEAVFIDFCALLQSLGVEEAASFPTSAPMMIDVTTVTLPVSTYNWYYVASISRNLCDQPSPDNVALAVSMIEKFLTMQQIVPLPGLVAAIVANVHLHYLREFQVTLVDRLAEVVNPLNHWAIENEIADHYPVLPEASLKILFVAGNTGKIASLLHTYFHHGLPVKVEWLINALPQSHPNPAHCVLKLCRTHLHNDQSAEQSQLIRLLLEAFEQIKYRVTNRDRQHASQVLSEWERRQLHPGDLCERFGRLFQVFGPNQSIQPGAGGSHTGTPRQLHPVVFRWDGGGHFIKLAGSFNEWTEYIPLVPDATSGSLVPQVILDLPEGIHQYKFIVDGEWQCDPHAPLLVEPLSGYKNNYISIGADFS